MPKEKGHLFLQDTRKRRERQRNVEVQRALVETNVVNCESEKKEVEGTLVRGSQSKSCEESGERRSTLEISNICKRIGSAAASL